MAAAYQLTRWTAARTSRLIAAAGSPPIGESVLCVT